MLIIAPPSESKRPPAREGLPVDIDRLSFPELAPTRRRIVDALVATSAGVDAFERLRARPSMAHEVARNTWLLEVPTMPAVDVYVGPLHQGLDATRLSPEAAARAANSLVIVSALWGALRPTDRIPPYRLHLFASLIGLDRLDWTWRTVLPDVLADAAGPGGVIVDLRAPPYRATGMPKGLGDRTVILRVDQGRRRHRIGDVIAKRVRGEAARQLLESGREPSDPGGLADVLGARWPVRLEPPEGRGKAWTMTLSVEE